MSDLNEIHDGDGPCRRCDDCHGEAHHWSDVYVQNADSEPDHPAAKAGHDVWYACKHCPAWRLDLDDDEDCDDEDCDA